MLLEATLKRLHLYDILEKGQKINQRLPGNGAGKEFVSKGAQGNLGTVEKNCSVFQLWYWLHNCMCLSKVFTTKHRFYFK